MNGLWVLGMVGVASRDDDDDENVFRRNKDELLMAFLPLGLNIGLEMLETGSFTGGFRMFGQGASAIGNFVGQNLDIDMLKEPE